MTLKNKKVLITCGPTWIPIDDIRTISNTSTGSLGQRIALDLLKAKARVTLLEGPAKNPLTAPSIKILKFEYFDELLKLIKNELKKGYDFVIHAAAVGDFKLQKPYKAKLHSRHKLLTLRLIPTPKIIRLIKKIDPKVSLVGFKQESQLNERLAKTFARNLIDQARCDWVVVNHSQNGKYEAYLVDSSGRILKHASSRTELSRALILELNRN